MKMMMMIRITMILYLITINNKCRVTTHTHTQHNYSFREIITYYDYSQGYVYRRMCKIKRGVCGRRTTRTETTKASL